MINIQYSINVKYLIVRKTQIVVKKPTLQRL